MRPSHRVALVCLVVLTAGCQFAPGGSQTTTRDPYGVPDTTRTTETTAPTSTTPPAIDVPGLSAEGVVDANALAEAHRASLRGRNYTLVTTHSERFANGSLRTRRFERVRFGADRDRFHYRAVVDGTVPGWLTTPTGELEVWSNGSIGLTRITTGNSPTYSRTVSGPPVRRQYDRLLVLFNVVETELSGSVTDENGSHYRLTSTRALHPEDLVSVDRRGRRSIDDVSNVTVSAWVDDTGRVQHYRLHYVVSLNGTRIRVVERVRVTAVGDTAVGRPDWLATALNRTDDPGSP